jgi:hypothetical protein
MPAQPTRLVLVGNTTCNGVSLHVSDRAVLTIRLSNDPRAAYQAPHPTTCIIRSLDRQSPAKNYVRKHGGYRWMTNSRVVRKGSR